MKYYRPVSLHDCHQLLVEHSSADLKILAGGTDIMPRAAYPGWLPDYLVDIKQLPELQGIEVTDAELRIGALTTMEEIRQDELIQNEYLALFLAVSQFAGLQIRNRATFGGNICNASPAGDTLPALYALKASLEILSAAGTRTIQIADFILGPGKVDLKTGEVLVKIILPRNHYNSTFYKLGLRDTMAIAVVSLAAVWNQRNGRIDHLELSAGSVAPTIVHLNGYAQAILESQDPATVDTDLIENSIQPIDDVRATARYRTKVLKNIARSTLMDIWAAKD